MEIEFQLTPGTEAPAEMNFWIGSKNALWMAENCTGTLHNLYTLRGAQVRDGNAWAEYIMESLALYGDKADVVFQSHNWPHWGNDTIQEYMTNTAAVYKFINDQTLLYINEGYTETEIANMIQLPEELEKSGILVSITVQFLIIRRQYMRNIWAGMTVILSILLNLHHRIMPKSW